jgi:hypothetical protein
VEQTAVVTLDNGRATRYAVTLPVRYRLAGSDVCETGWTDNMSVSGLLFTTAVMLELGSQLEVWVQMSSHANDGNRSMLYCNGCVVRQAGAKGGRPAAAVRITRLRVLPPIPDFTGLQTAPARGGQL